jgi:YVTN family beta-propeller protein
MGIVVQCPAIVRRLTHYPHGILATVAVSGWSNADSAYIAAPGGDHLFVVLGRSYIQPFDTRVNEGVILTADGAGGKILNSAPLGFFPGPLAAAPRVGRAFVTAATEFGIDTATDQLHTLDLRTGTILGTLTLGGHITDVAVDDSQDHILVVDSDNNVVRILDTRTGNVVHTIGVAAHPDSVLVAVSNDRAYVISHNSNVSPPIGTLTILRLHDGAILRTVRVDGESNFQIDEQAGRLFSATDNLVIMRDSQTGAILRRITVPGTQVVALVVGKRLHRVYTLNQNIGQVSILDARSGVLLRNVEVGCCPSAVAMDSQARRAYILNPHSNRLSILDGTSLRVIDTIGTNEAPLALGVDNRTGHVIVFNAGSSTLSVLGATP